MITFSFARKHLIGRRCNWRDKSVNCASRTSHSHRRETMDHFHKWNWKPFISPVKYLSYFISIEAKILSKVSNFQRQFRKIINKSFRERREVGQEDHTHPTMVVLHGSKEGTLKFLPFFVDEKIFAYHCQPQTKLLEDIPIPWFACPTYLFAKENQILFLEWTET